MTVELIDRLNDDQVTDLKRLFDQQWWTTGRTLPRIHTMLAHSDLVFGLCLTASGQLVGFARVLTDFAFKALVLDVIVDAQYQSRGLGRRLMDEVMTAPTLKEVNHFELYCLPEMIPLYEKWGFSSELGQLTLMRREAGD